MRFGSPYQNLQVILWHQKTEQLANGQWRELEPGFTAQFRGGDFDDYERGLLYERFGDVMRRGSRFTDDTLTTPAPTEWRIGTYDTGTIEDFETRTKVEQLLLDNFSNGHHYIALVKPKAAAPWPGYDNLTVRGKRTIEHVLDTIRNVVEQAQIDPDTVLVYEQANLNREPVVELLEEMKSIDAAVAEDLVDA
jgi:hypothetical protein